MKEASRVAPGFVVAFHIVPSSTVSGWFVDAFQKASPSTEIECHSKEELSGDSQPYRTSCSDRKSTRLNSSHVAISYAVFCLKKKRNKNEEERTQEHAEHGIV